MKKSVIVVILIFLIIIIYYNLDINYINKNDGFVEVNCEKKLYLKEKYGQNIIIPHLNIKGNIDLIDDENIIIRLSENANKYLNTETVTIKKEESINLSINEEVFLKFNNLTINNDIIEYETIELYKKSDVIQSQNKIDSFFISYSKHTKLFYKTYGKRFKYKDYFYFIVNGTDTNICYENVKNGVLLTEDYKSIFNVYYNTINNQETMFNIVVYQYMEE